MAYNYFSYSPYGVQNMPNYSDLQYPQPNIQPQGNTAKNGIIWVQGEAGAKAYPVAPNTTVQLWDSETQTIFLKSADGSGMPSMKILDYTIRDNSVARNPVTDMSGYVTREEFEKRLKEIADESSLSAVRKTAE